MLSVSCSVLVLLQLAATVTGYHLPQLVHTSCHLHAARVRRGHPELSLPEEKQGRSPLDEMGGAFKGGIEDAVKRVTGDFTSTCHLHACGLSQVLHMSPAQATKSTNLAILPGQQSRERRLVSRTPSKKLLATKSTNVIRGSNLKLAAHGVKPQPSPQHRSQALDTLVTRSENARPLVLASSW